MKSPLSGIGSFIGGHLMNTLINKVSKHCLRPVPDRMYTWLTLSNAGFYAAGTATGSAGFALNYLPFPLSQSGLLGVVFPNPVQALNATNPAGWKNLIQNSTTNTGIYTWCRIHKAKVDLTFMPQGSGDTINVAIAPVQGTAQNYSGYWQASQGPYGRQKVCEFSVPAVSNTISMEWDMSKLFSIPSKLYSGQIGTGFTNTTLPTTPLSAFANVQWRTIDSAVTSFPIGWNIKIQYLCEFWGTVDVALIDT